MTYKEFVESEQIASLRAEVGTLQLSCKTWSAEHDKQKTRLDHMRGWLKTQKKKTKAAEEERDLLRRQIKELDFQRGGDLE